MKNQSSKTLQNGSTEKHTKRSKQNTKHKISQFYLYFSKISHLEHISKVLTHCLKCESILRAKIEPGLPVVILALTLETE